MSYCNVGCNVVVPEIEDCMAYTAEVYLEHIEPYRKLGFRHLEFSHLMALSVEEALVIREHCRECGIIPWSVHSEHWNDGILLEEYLATQEHCARVADALDARIMVCHLPNVNPRLGDFERDLEAITKLADITRKYKLKLAIEGCLAGDWEYIIKIVDTLDRVDVGTNLDTGHASLYSGEDLGDLIHRLGPRIFTLHIQDNFGHNDDHLPPGIGLINWQKTLQALKQVGYRGSLMMEMTSPVIKKHRSVTELKELALEKELIGGKTYLEHVWATLV